MADSDEKRDDKKHGLTRTLIQADRMVQIAFMLPAAVFVGWLIGAGLDLWLHQHWIYIVGILVGIGAGFVQIFRLLHEMEGGIDGGRTGKTGSGNEKDAEEGRIRKEPK